MSKKVSKESLYLFLHLGLGSDPPIGSDRDLGRDKLVSEPRFGRFWKSLRLLMYLHRMCWPNADVFFFLCTD